MKRTYVILSILLILSCTLSASWFSFKRQGIGLRQYSNSVRGMGLGNTGIASLDSLALNYYGMSQLRHINNTRISVGMQYQWFNTELNLDGLNTSFDRSTANFAGINLAVPVIKGKWAFGVSWQPFSTLDFETSQDFEQLTPSGDTLRVSELSRHNGTISKAQFNLAWSPTPILGLALTANYYLGNYKNEYSYLLSFASADSTNSDADNSIDPSHNVDYRLRGGSVGLAMDIQPTPNLTFAGFIDLKAPLNLTVAYDTDGYVDTTGTRNIDNFPVQYGAGAYYKFSNRLGLTADFAVQEWSSALLVNTADVEDWYRWGIGLERHSARRRSAGFWDRADLRLGFSSTQLGYKFNGNSVLQTAGHLGLGLPFGFYNNRIDLGLSFGIRGNNDSNLASERFVDFQLSVSLGELWFQRTRK